jgi:hypothetical protein
VGRLIYYAHSKQIYNTQREKDELAKIAKLFPGYEIICPNRDIGESSMEPYLKAVLGCDIVVFSEYKKHIGKGVYGELEVALHAERPVFLLYGKRALSITGIERVDPNDWIIRYGRVIR